MGSKSDSPFPKKKQPSPTPRPKPTRNDGGGGDGPPSKPPVAKCWDFSLSSLTEAASTAKKRMTVDGIPRGSRVLIHADIGVLGDAPPAISSKMIAAQVKTGGALAGEITDVNTTAISVHMCIS